jgi:chromosome segregation ATPase
VQSGISSGQYQRRVDARQVEAVDKQRQVEVAIAESDRLQGEIAASRERERVIRARIASQRAELSRLSGDIDRLAGQGDLTPGEAGMRRAQVDYLQQRQTALQQSPADNPDLQKKAAALQNDIDALSKALARVKN